MNARKLAFAMLVALALTAASALPASATTAQPDIDTSVNRGAAWIKSQQNLTNGAITGFGGDWSISALAAAGDHAADVRGPAVGDPPALPPSLQDYYLADWTANAWLGNPTRPATDYERATLLAYAAGLDPARLSADQNLLAQLAGIYTPSTGTFGSASLLNGQMFALLALGRTKMPKSVLARNVHYMRQHVHADGGFTFSTVTTAASYNAASDIDMTGAAIGGFCEAGVPTSDPIIQNAIAFLKSKQVDATGGFNHMYGVNTDSAAWAVSGLNACGIDPQGVEFTTPSGKTPIDYLISQQLLPDPPGTTYGSFRYTTGVAANLYSSQNAVRALAGEAFTSEPAPRANAGDSVVKPAPVVPPGTLVPLAIVIDNGTGTLQLCKITAPTGITVAQVLDAGKTASYPAGCISELTSSGNAITSINGFRGNGSGNGWKVSIDRSAEANPGATTVKLGDTIQLRLEKPAVEFGNQPQASVGPQQTFRFYAVDQTRSIREVVLDGANADDFSMTRDTCSWKTLRVGEMCMIQIRFVPSAQGARSAQLRVPGAFTTDPTLTLNGVGTSLPQGPTGATGAQGSTGATGAQGEAGSTGATGAQGETGSTGATGASGENGENGATGATGAQGATGATGANGANGQDGATGATGANGQNGTDGQDGDDGAPGAKGDPGVQGPQGAPGPQGAQGPAGRDARVTCTVKRGKRTQKVTCKVALTSSVAAKGARVTLLKGSRVIARGTARSLTISPKLRSGNYVLVAQNGATTEARTVSIKRTRQSLVIAAR